VQPVPLGSGHERSIMSPRGSANARAAAAYGAAALVLVLTRHSPDFAFLGARAQLFGWLGYVAVVTAGIPAAVMRLGFRQTLAASGLTWGLARRDAGLIALGLLGVVAAAALLSRHPEVRAYYPRDAFVKSEPWRWLPLTLAFASYGLAWELLFRGHLLLGVVPRFGRAAVLLQAVPFAVAHIDKPALEAWLSIPAGLLFGLVAFRTRSVLPGFLLHFTLSTSVNLFCAYGRV